MKNEYIDSKIKELEQKANRTGQFHLDSINNKMALLEKKLNDSNDYKKLWEENTHDYNVLARKRLDDYSKINVLEKKVDNMLMLEQDIDRKIFAKMDTISEDIDVVAEEAKEDIREVNFRITRLEQSIPDINQPTDQTEALKEDYDILEVKYHQLRSELDSIYKVLEMDALDIQDLYNKLENHPKKQVIECDDQRKAYDVSSAEYKEIKEELNNAK
jgi:hypothetical protein